MSKLTSLLKSGKRKIVNRMLGQTALGRPDQEMSHDVTRPTQEPLPPDGLTRLGRPDQGITHDVTRPTHEPLYPAGQTALSRSYQGMSHDVTRP